MTRLLGALVAILFLSLAGTAGAVHWPYFGGDAGRSGLQPVDEGATPLTFAYSVRTFEQQDGITPVITTAGGGPSVQRVAYGTRDGLVQLRILGTGAVVGPVDGIDITEDDNSDDTLGNFGFADSSIATALGQLFVVHNEGTGIEIAQIDEADGSIVKQVAVAGSANTTVRSSPILTGPDASGGRILFFVASNGDLFRVPIGTAGAKGATIGQATKVAADATPTASPAFLNLRNAAGSPAPYVAVGTRANNSVRTFAVADLAAGPASGALASLTGGSFVVQTPSVPVAPDGNPPASAPFVYVAVRRQPLQGAVTTTVSKLSQDGNGGLVERAESDALPGTPASALAVNQKAPASGAPAEGKVVVTTNQNLFVLNTSDLKGMARFDPESDLATTSQGFVNNVALVSGAFIFVARDDGDQFVLRQDDAQPVPGAEFSQDAVNVRAIMASGQPSLSRGFVQYVTDAGLFVYRTRDLVPPVTAVIDPGEGQTVGGAVRVAATAADARGIASVTFRLNGQPFASDNAPDAGSPFNAAAPAVFSATLDASRLPNGTYTLDAVASDGTLTTTSAARRIVVDSRVVQNGDGNTGQSGGPRVKAKRITAKLKPSRDRRRPYRFTVSGRLTLPSGVSRAQGCGSGRFSVQTKAGRKTISTRRARLSSTCSYKVRVSFKNRKRFGRRSKLSIRVRFLGNDRLRAQSVRTLRARVR